MIIYNKRKNNIYFYKRVNMINRILIPDILQPVSHYCHAVEANGIIWISGLVGMNFDGTIPNNTKEQFDIAMRDFNTCLEAAGGSYSDVVKVRVFLTNIADRTIINPKRIDYFGEHKPASTLLEVSALVDPRMTVEIEAEAVIQNL
jgi:2-iminobutanoate/2-iminopropanoate deaminase